MKQTLLIQFSATVLCLMVTFSYGTAMNCKGIAFRCMAPPTSCPEGQSVLLSTYCSCGCRSCSPTVAEGAEGSVCSVANPTCLEGLKCCHGTCVKPKRCCTKINE